MTSRTVRWGTSRDAIDLARIHRSARSAAMPWLPELHTPEQDVNFFVERVLPADTVLVVDLDGSIVGFIAYSSGWVNHLYIAPQNWAQGHGSELLDRAKAASRYLQLWTFQANHRARRFYAKHGFTQAELTDGQQNEEKAPDVRLVWTEAKSG